MAAAATRLAAEPPAWAGLLKNSARMSGGAAGPAANGHALAREAFGEAACRRPVGGLLAFAYLWRRFGPSPDGYDDYKELASYYLATPDPEVGLWVSPRLSGLAMGVGYVVTEALMEQVLREYAARRSGRRWRPEPPWREDPGSVGRVGRALMAALVELKRPVGVRDSAMSVLGPCKGPRGVRHAPPSELAGLGVPLEPMRKLLEPERPARRRKKPRGG
jgi:hypothetical protein